MSTAARQRAPRIHNDLLEDNASSIPMMRPRRAAPLRRRGMPITVVVSGCSILVLLVVGVSRRIVLFQHPSRPRHAYKHDGSIPMSGPLQPIPNSSPKPTIMKGTSSDNARPILTAYLEPPHTLPSDLHFPRNTAAEHLKMIQYPQVQQCSRLFETWPVDNFPSNDPFLPWIHDVFPSDDGKYVKFVAQNKRRCDSGPDHTDVMKHWEPQMSLFQPVPVHHNAQTGRYRLSSPRDATTNETRFICRFHTATGEEYTTLSEFPFNYEYVTWRKGKNAMFERTGKDMEQFWLSQLLFSCPIPEPLQDLVQRNHHVQDDISKLWLDLIPIRTPARHGEYIFTEDHVGAENLQNVPRFNTTAAWGTSHILPEPQDSGRWANIPICQSPTPVEEKTADRNKLVACTWTAASYTRRGDAVSLGDTAARLREWIAFHLVVGFTTIYVYDNTVPGTDSPLQAIAQEFEGKVVYHRWPCQVCNNNRPNHPNPGERSSQYAAEASCRERYGPTTKWMAFMDTDEYLVPMLSDTWHELLDRMESRQLHILKMRSSRTKPRLSLMEVADDQSTCVETDTKKKFSNSTEACVAPRKNETFLRVYNCEFIKPPRPQRFERAMKQIYRPKHVLNHFVHYSTVTADVARLRKDFGPNEEFARNVHQQSWKENAPEIFLNELTEGTLIHTKSILPQETMHRVNECLSDSKYNCALGFSCPDHVEFNDAMHKKNAFQDDEGKYCNCWMNHFVEDTLIPKLEASLAERKKIRSVAASHSTAVEET